MALFGNSNIYGDDDDNYASANISENVPSNISNNCNCSNSSIITATTTKRPQLNEIKDKSKHRIKSEEDTIAEVESELENKDWFDRLAKLGKSPVTDILWKLRDK